MGALRTAITVIPLQCAAQRALIDVFELGFGAAVVCIIKHSL